MSNDDTTAYARLLRRSQAAVAMCAALVVVCYLFVDRPVATFVHDRGLSDYPLLRWLTLPPPVVETWTPAVLAALMVRRAFGPFRRWERAVLAAGVGLILADQFRETIGYAAGRTWPGTWTENNPSYLRDGAFGFHPFHGGSGYGSFPSGHTARTAAVAAVVWVAFPRWRWAGVAATLAVAAGLIGMNYHFVGDVIAGGFLGGIVGVYTARGIGIEPFLIFGTPDVHDREVGMREFRPADR